MATTRTQTSSGRAPSASAGCGLLSDPAMEESKLLERLRLIEALHAGATSTGEKVAAAEARKRIQARLASIAQEDPPIEFRFSLVDGWSRKLFAALCRRYDVKPYRYRGQRRTT